MVTPIGAAFPAGPLALVLSFSVAALSACPREPAELPAAPATGTAAPALDAAAPVLGAAPSYPAACLSYLLAALEHPTEGYPSLGASWGLIAGLPNLARSPNCAELRANIGGAVRKAGADPPPELVGAWLATHPEPAARWLEARLAGGGERYLPALKEHPTQRRLLAQLDLARVSAAGGAEVLELLRHWGAVRPEDRPALTLLLARPEPALSLRAAGYLLQLDRADAAALAQLRSGIRDALATGDAGQLAAAAEGARISGLAALSSDFVPWISAARLGPEQAQAQAELKEAYASYAVCSLGGADGLAIARQLLKAEAPELRWKGRLGLLLGGEPAEWQAAIEAQGPASRDLWLALEPREVLSPALLPTYARAARSPEPRLRGSAALHLGRYSNIPPASADYTVIRESLSLLVADVDSRVAAAAWRSAGGVQLGGLEAAAEALLGRAEAQPELRLAACEYLMRLSLEPQAEQ